MDPKGWTPPLTPVNVCLDHVSWSLLCLYIMAATVNLPLFKNPHIMQSIRLEFTRNFRVIWCRLKFFLILVSTLLYPRVGCVVLWVSGITQLGRFDSIGPDSLFDVEIFLALIEGFFHWSLIIIFSLTRPFILSLSTSLFHSPTPTHTNKPLFCLVSWLSGCFKCYS